MSKKTILVAMPGLSSQYEADKKTSSFSLFRDDKLAPAESMKTMRRSVMKNDQQKIHSPTDM